MGRLNYSIKINRHLNFNGFYEISNGKLKQHKLREKYDFINLIFKI